MSPTVADKHTRNRLILRRPTLSRQRSRVRVSSSPPFIPKGLLPFDYKSSRTQKGTFSCPFCVLFHPLLAARFRHAAASADGDDCEAPIASAENTNDSTAACAACLAGVIAWV